MDRVTAQDVRGLIASDVDGVALCVGADGELFVGPNVDGRYRVVANVEAARAYVGEVVDEHTERLCRTFAEELNDEMRRTW